MPIKRKKRSDMSPVERAIFSRERGIARMKENINSVRERANEEIAEINSRIAEKQTLLDALKRGTLKP